MKRTPPTLAVAAHRPSLPTAPRGEGYESTVVPCLSEPGRMLTFQGINGCCCRIGRVEWPIPPLKLADTEEAAGTTDTHDSVSRFARTDSGRRRGEIRPYRHRDAVDLRPPDALQLKRRLSDADHQEAPAQGHHPRAALVSQRRHQHQISARPRRHHLG